MALATDVMFSNLRDDYRTPVAFYQRVEERFGGFSVDLAASKKNRVVPFYFGPDQTEADLRDALAVSWVNETAKRGLRPVGWCNPPYSLLAAFLAKAEQERQRGFCSALLLPVRSDTAAWHTYVWDRERQRPRRGIGLDFVRGRLQFYLDVSDEMRQAVRRHESDWTRPRNDEERRAFEKVISRQVNLPVLIVRAILDNEPEAVAGAPFPSVVVSFHPETKR